MRSVDTNILIRYITADSPGQSPLARELIECEPIFVGVTVVLECEWVLRDVYGYSTQQIGAAFRVLLGLPTITVENANLVAQSVEWLDAGLEFADAFHLARSDDCQDLVTFDRKFARRAKSLDTVPVTLLSA